jgi:2-keto-3-deoxy-L-rhamnonate aldolase RhmA
MPDLKTLKSRIHAGEFINQVRLPNHSTTEQVQQAIQDTACDLIYIDAQHGAICEWDIVRICSAAEALGVPVQMRIKHLKEVYLIGHYLDLGLSGIKVPEVKDADTVTEAVNAFYFPPYGQRSWGGWVGYGIADRRDRLQYAQWWNQNGILGIKIESIKAVLAVRELAQPGVDYLDFGPADLSFDIETHPHPHLKTVEDCITFVKRELTGVDIRIL